MSIRIQSQSEEKEADLSAWKILGPACILCTLAIAFQSPGNADLFAVAIIGLFFSAKWRLRGLIYSLSLLFLVALAKHFLFMDEHFWRIGLEGSIAIGFATTALAFEWSHTVTEGWRTAALNREQTIRHLEEETAKNKAEDQQQLIALQDRVAELKKETEESLSDAASLQILNEVVRKQAAEAFAEREVMAEAVIEKDRRIAAILSELETVQSELALLQDAQRLKDELDQLKVTLGDAKIEQEQLRLSHEALQQFAADQATQIVTLEAEIGELKPERESLRQSLDETRAQKEQVQNINETLERMVATHNQRAQSLEQKVSEVEQQLVERNSLTSDLARWKQVVDRLSAEKNFLQERLTHTENNHAFTAQKLQHAEEQLVQAEQLRIQVEDSERTASEGAQWRQKADEIATRANFLEQRLSDAETELSFTSTKLEQAEEELQQAQAAAAGKVDGKDGLIRHLEERVQNLTQTQSLYFQLKKQFEDKNQVLSQTRAELFRAETSLDALKLEKEQTPPKPLDENLLAGLEKQIATLEAENEELTELITVLSDPSSIFKKSKKKNKEDVN